MPEVAKLLVASKLINKVAKCSYVGEGVNELLGQIFIYRYDGKIMIGAMNGFAMAMRKADFDPDGMSSDELQQAHADYDAALGIIGHEAWMFPADLKIPNGMNVTITLYLDFTSVLHSRVAVYGPFQRLARLKGTEFNINDLFFYPQSATGVSRAVNPALLAKLSAALGDKNDILIINTTGGPDDPMYFKTVEGNAYGVIMPFKGEVQPDDPDSLKKILMGMGVERIDVHVHGDESEDADE